MIIHPTRRPAVKAAIAILDAAFTGYASVGAQIPRQRPARFVRVSRVGGGMMHPVTDRARILVECFGADVETVESMTGTASAALFNASATTVLTDVFVRAWENEEGPVDLPHPDILDMVRWQFHGDLLLSTTPGS